MHHFILTRWNVPLGSQSAKFNRGLDEEWLRHRARLFERVTLPSIDRQTVQDFDWLLLMDADSPDWLFQRSETWPARVVRVTTPKKLRFAPMAYRLAAVLEMVTITSSRWVLSTRLDNDDALGPKFVETIQGAFRRCNEWLVIPQGAGLCDGTFYAIEHARNPFTTLVETAWPWKTCYCEKHGYINRQAPVRFIDSEEPCWLLNVHEHNVTNGPQSMRRGVVNDSYAKFFSGVTDDAKEPV